MNTLSILSPKVRAMLCAGTLTLSLTACKKPPEAPKGNTGDSTIEFTGTVTDLLKKGEDVHCTFEREDSGFTMHGTVYITQNNRMRGDFTMENTPLGTMQMHVIRDGNYNYTWGFPSETQGNKVELDTTGMPVEKNDNDPNIDEAMDYTCTAWNVDESLLTVPSTVTFTDISAEVELIQGTMQNSKDQQCAACDNVPGAAKEQCLQALGCL